MVNFRRVAIQAVIWGIVLLQVPVGAQESKLHRVRIELTAPGVGGPVYITGNLPQLGPWDPRKFEMTRDAERYTAALDVPEGATLEFKFTLGSWEREALGPDGSIPANHRVVVDADKTLKYTVTHWRERTSVPARPAPQGSGVLGTLVYHYDLASKHLKFPRHVAVWLPPGYERDAATRYPVLYMHDGQNLFDPRIANTGVDWGVDEAVVGLVNAGKIRPIIVVGIFSTPARTLEYNPLVRGEDYARFIIDELKPMIDSTYRTRAEPRYTGVCGSSAGGLISLGLGWEHPDVFTRIGALSAHLPPIPARFGGTDESILDKIEAGGPLDRSLRIYIDRGAGDIDATYGPYHERLRKMLVGWGWKEGQNLLVREYPGTRHTEADWRKRLPVVLEFLFGDWVE